MSVLQGVPVSAGYAAGIAIAFGCERERRLVLPKQEITVADVERESDRLDDAVQESNRELQQGVAQARLQRGRFNAAELLEAHSLLVDEIGLLVKEYVRREMVHVEQALEVVVAELADRLRQMDSVYLCEREQDVRDVGLRIGRHLSGVLTRPKPRLPPHSIVVTEELLPSEAIELMSSGLTAIVSCQGGNCSHTAILAQSLGIPLVSGIRSYIAPGTRLLVDGVAGRVTLNPSRREQRAFSALQLQHESSLREAQRDEPLACVTQDGIGICLLANICFPRDVTQVKAHCLEGVGLFRTEFLLLDAQERPSLGTQLRLYRETADALESRPLVVRTFDLGGDKLPPFLLAEATQSRASLSLRGLRFSLAEQDLFDTQLRAIVQAASPERDLRILFPMVIGRHDFSAAVAAVDRVCQHLGVEPRPPLGAMIETPAALFALDEILDVADFIAIGTNDLTQYLLAVDRDSADAYNPYHPAVLRAIRLVVEAAAAKKCPVSVCGEAAGDADFACLLIGLGVRTLSLSPARVTSVRQAVSNLDCGTAREIAMEAIRCESVDEVRAVLSGLRPETAQEGVQFVR